MYCIQEADKLNFINCFFNHIELEGNKLILPVTGEKKIKETTCQKLIKKTNKILKKTISKRIVVSKKIQEQQKFMQLLYTIEDLEIIDGKWLYELICIDILNYLCMKKQIKKEQTKISILVNDLSLIMLENIKEIAKQYKSVNIVTNHIEKFKKIEKKIFEQEGNMITVGNNKKRGIAKSNIILNVDFPTELINKYNIYENAYIINLKGNVKIEKKRFEGLNINDFDITFKELKEEECKIFKKAEIYEAGLNKRQTYIDLQKQLEKDEVKITKLIANHSIL